LAKIVKSIIIIDERERGRMGEWRCIEEHHLPVFKVIQLKGTELVPLLGGPREAGGGVLKSITSPSSPRSGRGCIEERHLPQGGGNTLQFSQIILKCR
jgi:hypothetical protein